MITIYPYTASIADDGDANVLLSDHMPPVNDMRHNENGWHKNTITDLFISAKIDASKKVFLADHYLLFEDFNNLTVFNNIFVRDCDQFLHTITEYHIDFFRNVEYQMTFMSNKPRQHRVLCSMIIANCFDNVKHTFNTIEESSVVVHELLLHTDYKFDENQQLRSSWNELTTAEVHTKGMGVRVKLVPTDLFKSLKDLLFTGAATSIVTEPCFYERGNMLTEKTLMSIYAGHFMIWPGAWKLAETAKRIGLDVFGDYIDHSYQYLEHPGERVVEAFMRNKAFLTNIELQQEARDNCRDRLQANLDLVRDIPRLTAAIQSLSTYVPD